MFEPLRLTTVMACKPTAPGNAREWLRSVTTSTGLDDNEGLSDDLELCLSELITNATQAGAEIVSITVACKSDVVELSVTDDGPGMPVLQTTKPTDEHGRGLQIIAGVSQDWGVRSFGPGKTVWATLAR